MKSVIKELHPETDVILNNQSYFLSIFFLKQQNRSWHVYHYLIKAIINLASVYIIGVMSSQNKQPSVRIQQNILIVNGTIAPYAKQIIRSPETLFVTDLAIEVPITQELRAYDEYYFHHLLKKQIVSELESNHSSIGLEILQQLPDLQAQHYEYLLSRISFQKLAKLLMDDNFLLFLCQNLRRVLKLPTNTDEAAEKSIIINMPEPYQRAIYLLASIQESCGSLNEKLEITCKMFIYDIIDQPNFIQNLAFPSQLSPDFGDKLVPDIVESHFLQKLQQHAIYLRILQNKTSLQWQIDQYYLTLLGRNGKVASESNILLQSKAIQCSIKNNLFNKPCLNFIANYFHHFFHYNRKGLLKILVLIITHNRQQFWKQLIHVTPDCQQKSEGITDNQLGQFSIDNSNSLREFMLNNYFSNDGFSWSQSLFVLENLNQENEAEAMLTDLYQDLVQFPLRVDIVQLIAAFIKATAKPDRELSLNFRLLLSAFFQAVSLQIDQMSATYTKQLKRIDAKNKHLMRQMGIFPFPKINKILFCAFIRVFALIISSNLLEFLHNFSYQKTIQKLIAMSFGNDSAIYGAKTQLIRLIKSKTSCNHQELLPIQGLEGKRNNIQTTGQASIQRLRNILEMKNF